MSRVVDLGVLVHTRDHRRLVNAEAKYRQVLKA